MKVFYKTVVVQFRCVCVCEGWIFFFNFIMGILEASMKRIGREGEQPEDGVV